MQHIGFKIERKNADDFYNNDWWILQSVINNIKDNIRDGIYEVTYALISSIPKHSRRL